MHVCETLSLESPKFHVWNEYDVLINSSHFNEYGNPLKKFPSPPIRKLHERNITGHKEKRTQAITHM